MATPRKARAGRKPATRTTGSAKHARPAARPRIAVQELSPCLWFDDQAEEAARFYVSVFRKGKIKQIFRYPRVGQEIHGRPAGSVMTVEFVLNGIAFTALNGGPLFKFNEAISMQVLCDTQEEVDYYWKMLCEGGDAKAQACGWLKDKYGLSWQIVPRGMGRMMRNPDSPRTERAFAAMMRMKKLDIAALEAAYKG